MGEIWVATKALILYNKRALIIQRSNYCGVGENEWEFAGGGLKFGEDLLDGLSREILEEVGLTVRIDRLLYAISRLVNPQRQIIGLTYLCYANTDKVILSNEHRNFLWATREQLEKMLTKPMLDDLTINSVLEQLDII
ncbi:NUDIX domain-containing protein [Anaerocolumna sedimenticola]|uniref:NUDIX domain-containing protein n=1 Tax=Anaerocolumna sedimenticola TaxID=2696063 RepID=A0A6P1TJC7_9FIRM|nr:NUDIX domain-containing protein [Anaerocolumna sedimenticola]QHQ61300.1 NUDIX domain-containing protein [Anaerocolumna sedimenticola]